MKTSESISAISKAISQVQLEIENPANSAVNPFYKSKYAPLPDVLNIVRPLLGKYGLAVIQNPYTEGEVLSITTRITHESGEWIETDPLFMKPEKNTPQGVGSAITYGRRYALSAVLGIASEEDDDGNSNEPDKQGKSKKEDKPKPNVELEKIIANIGEVATNLAEKGIDKNVIGSTIKAIFTDAKGKPSANYNAIKDIETANKVLDALNKIGG
jgi:hypothetical protein